MTSRRRSSQSKPSGPAKRKPVAKVPEDAIALERGSGGPERGGGSGGKYWHIRLAGKRAGYVFINMVDDDEFGPHASIQIHINAALRGQGIGSIAYCQACEQSGLAEIYAHMRKSNEASRRAALHAGFVEVDQPSRQLVMVWRAPSTS
ncbi:MAG: hypothetical protein QOI95_71 [Acidimicrobiaceae bacterium]|jgi:ribosomal protein S18 acetylase RimI-like enzyme